MVYDYWCVVVFRPNCFTTSAKMRFFWLSLLTMNCGRESFIHICEWKRCSPSSRSSSSILWILLVATVALGSTSMIYFPFSIPLSGFDLDFEPTFDSEAFSSATNDCLAQHSLVLWVELLWNSHHFPMSFFVFVVSFFACGFDGLSWVPQPWLGPLFCGLGASFPFFGCVERKSRFFYLNLCQILTAFQYVMSSEEMSRNSISP